MKTLVIGLEGATPDLLFGDERLTTIRALMQAGAYGQLQSTFPSTAVPAWLSFATSQDPGSLGIYGRLNRIDRSYGPSSPVVSSSSHVPTIWDQFIRAGKRAVIVGVPPNYPPRVLNGISIGCFLTPPSPDARLSEPADIANVIRQKFGPYPAETSIDPRQDQARLRDQMYADSRTRFAVVRYLLESTDWDYFQFVEIGPDRLQRLFWSFHDPKHPAYPGETLFRDTIRDYYAYLDEEVAGLLQCLTEDTAILVVSDHGAQCVAGGFCTNQWLLDQGWLARTTPPKGITPFARLDIDWTRTYAWAEGGDLARIHLNVEGREPRGALAVRDYERFRDEVKSRLETTLDPMGRPLGAVVLKPEEIYRSVNGVAADLIAQFGDPVWQAIDSVGHPTCYVQHSDMWLDGCGATPSALFVLAASALPARGELQGVTMLDLAPTLLTISGQEVPGTMQGRPVIDPATLTQFQQELDARAEALTRERLRGLGYLG